MIDVVLCVFACIMSLRINAAKIQARRLGGCARNRPKNALPPFIPQSVSTLNGSVRLPALF
jgi:hypothetical protein